MEVLIALKAWILNLIPAAIGSALSLYVSKEKNSLMGRFELFAVFLFGIFIAHYIGGAAIEYSEINHLSITADAIKLTTGLIGMAVITNLVTQIPLAFDAARKKWLGE
jgi:NO-binding membrane sensor protein with MHYT domain